MKFRPLLAFGLLLGVEAQSSGSGSGGGDEGGATTPSPGGGGSTTNPPTTTPPPTTPTPTNGGGGSNTGGGDVTVTRTTTVTGEGGEVTVGTTAFTTITSTIVVTMTEFETTTITEDAETSTKTVYETSTQWANMRRAIDLAPRTVGPEYFSVEAIPTDTPTVDDVEVDVFELIRRGRLFKRATITEFVTVTAGGGKTVTSAVTKTVISTISDETTATSTVTSTEAANAKTTVTVTSTLVITSTAVTTGVVQTATVAPSGSYGPDGTGGASNDGNKSNSGGGLSTGAKAGIGAGVGVAGLIVIGGLLWFCVKKRRDNKNKFESDDMFGSSEVPVGPAGRTQPAMASQHDRDVAAGIISPRPMPPKPASPEGYRGTAPGDGRTGFAKPDAFGAAYSATSPETMYSRTTTAQDSKPDVPELSSPANTAELSNDGGTARWHETNAAEIDGNQISNPRGSAPPSNVYEMPAQNYK